MLTIDNKALKDFYVDLSFEYTEKDGMLNFAHYQGKVLEAIRTIQYCQS